MKLLKLIFKNEHCILYLVFTGDTVCICGKTGYAVSDLSGLPDHCAFVLSDDHCRGLPVARNL